MDALSIAALMSAAGWSKKVISIANVGFAIMCPLGALGAFFGMKHLGGIQPMVLGSALGFSAGVFLCIALADILPEVQFHRHDRLGLTAALIGGIMLAWVIGKFEPEHAHEVKRPHGGAGHGEHSHGGDAHGASHEGSSHHGHEH